MSQHRQWFNINECKLLTCVYKSGCLALGVSTDVINVYMVDVAGFYYERCKTYFGSAA